MYHRRQSARVVLFGMRCGFTAPVLERLAAAPDVDLRAVVFPERGDTIPASVFGPALDPGRVGDITLLGLAGRAELASPAFHASLEANAPDVIVVACFPWRLPEWLLALPGSGCLNVHPSLLPDGRGPEPVFWAFRWGMAETGVTVHLMDAGFDTGPIVSQSRVAIGKGATIGSLERTLAQIGAELLIEILPTVLDGSAAAAAQVGEPARYARKPRRDDLIVPTTWTAHDAARFIRAIAQTHGPVPVLVQSTGQRLAVTEAIDVESGTTIPDPVRVRGSEAQIQFSPGMLTCRLATRCEY